MADNSQSRTAKRQAEQTNKKQVNKKHTSRFKKVMLTIVTLVLIIGLFVAGLFIFYIVRSPELDPDKLSVPASTKVYDQNNELFADLGEEQREKVTYEELPDFLIDAVLATEDVRYFDHFGIDLKRIGGAVLANISDGFGAEGGSTITQQVIKGAFLYPDKTLERKVQEQWLAIQLDAAYSKEAILEMYLNRIFYGSGGYGIKTAARNYFNVEDLNELTLSQAALLAGLPQRPSAYDPTVNPDLAKERMETVLTLMVRHGKITETEKEEALNVEIEDMLNLQSATRTAYTAFLDQVRIELDEKLGIDLYNDGVEVYTTLDPNAQSYVEYLLSEESPVQYPDEELQSGLSVVDTKTGAIQAIGGGRDRTAGGFNMAIQAKRQPGSAIKPVLSYGPAVEYLDWSTYHLMNDDQAYPTQGSSDIKNAGSRYRGWITLRDALTHSSNVVAVKTFDEVGRSNATDFAEQLGMPIPADGLNIRDAIGGSQMSVSSLQMAGAYSAFGNEGLYNEPYAVTKVVFPDGREETLASEPIVAMSEATAYMVTDMMKSVVRNGTGQSAAVSGLPIAGKTGTTNDNVDSWFAGLTTNYTIAVWTGYHEDATRSVPDTSISRQLFKNMITELSKNIETSDFTQPNSVVSVAIEKGSNPAERPSDFTPDDQIVTELFKAGTEPTAVSDAYEQLDPVENLTATYDEETATIDVTWEHESEQDVEYEVTYQQDGNNQSTTTEATNYTINEVVDDTSYTINVTVFSQEDVTLTSETKTIDLQIPAREEEEEPDDEVEEPEQPTEDEEEPDIDQDNGNNGNGNGANDDEEEPEAPIDDEEPVDPPDEVDEAA